MNVFSNLMKAKVSMNETKQTNVIFRGQIMSIKI
jgi:hypothetical protein